MPRRRPSRFARRSRYARRQVQANRRRYNMRRRAEVLHRDDDEDYLGYYDIGGVLDGGDADEAWYMDHYDDDTDREFHYPQEGATRWELKNQPQPGFDVDASWYRYADEDEEEDEDVFETESSWHLYADEDEDDEDEDDFEAEASWYRYADEDEDEDDEEEVVEAFRRLRRRAAARRFRNASRRRRPRYPVRGRSW